MKKLLAVLLALAMVMSLGISAYASDVTNPDAGTSEGGEGTNGSPTTFTLTITGAYGHVYDVYQLFTGTVSQEGDDTVLSNVKYGKSYGNEGEAVSIDLLNDIVNSADPISLLKFAVHDDPIIKEISPSGNNTSIEITDLPGGYYMIVDVSENVPNGETLSPTMLQVVEDVTVASKHATIYSEKKVKDVNDSIPNAYDAVWKDSADYDIGDSVPFKLSVTLPSNFNSYVTSTRIYTLTIHDNQAKGLDTPVITRVYIADNLGTPLVDILPMTEDNVNGYKLHESCPKPDTCEFKGCSFAIEVGDISAYYDNNMVTFKNGHQLIVEYTSVLNDNANIGRDDNENAMYVCHPDGHTVIDYVTVLTYQLKINKIDGATKKALEGAGFTLYKWNAAENAWTKVGDEIKGEKITSFIWTGIDGGKYKLVETTTPTNYNTMADLEFAVDANHLDIWTPDGNSAFEDLIAHGATMDIVIFRDKDEQNIEDGILEGNIENHKGVVLPETGAEGTMMLIASGATLVILAAVFLVTRKKMSIYED